MRDILTVLVVTNLKDTCINTVKTCVYKNLDFKNLLG